MVMGVSGSGKTTVGRLLALRLGIAFVDSDDLHGPENIAKMSRGESLSDEDRAPWIERVGSELLAQDLHPAGVVIACSGLRRRHRDRIRTIVGPALRIVFLSGDYATIQARLAQRPDHFMPPSLLASQFDALELPSDEPDVTTVSIDQDAAAIVELAVTAVATDDYPT